MRDILFRPKQQRRRRKRCSKLVFKCHSKDTMICHSGSRGQRRCCLGIPQWKEQRSVSPCPSSPWSCELARSRGTPSVSSVVGRRSGRARSSGVNPDDEAPMPFTSSRNVFCPFWTSPLFFSNLVVLLSERDRRLLVVDGRSNWNSSSSGQK